MKRLVRGVIYDNPVEVETRAVETAECLTALVGVIGEYCYKPKSIPTRDEYVASAALFGLINPITGDRNMIIPASLVDDRLYSELERVDIGETLVHDFIQATYRKHEDEDAFFSKVGETENKYVADSIRPEDFCCGKEECLLKHVDKQDKNRGKYFIDGKEVSGDEMCEFLKDKPELADVVPLIKTLNGKVSCF